MERRADIIYDGQAVLFCWVGFYITDGYVWVGVYALRDDLPRTNK